MRRLPISLCILGALGFSLCATPHSLSNTTAPASRTAGGSNLRQIGQASLIYAQSHQDRLPEATDIWDYARLLATDAGLDDARLWQAPIDPANKETGSERSLVLLPAKSGKPSQLNPDFRKIKPSVAVAIGRLRADSPSTTPIAWTRGLQPDGTWAPHSPYGTAGGHIVFIGGNVAFYKNLKGENGLGELINRDGAPTFNILDALPRGTRIAEYIPTPEEQLAWAKAKRTWPAPGCIRIVVSDGWILIALIWFPFVAISTLRLRGKKPDAFSIFLVPLILTVLLLAIVPSA